MLVHENRAYLESRQINVPWSNKQLEVTWEGSSQARPRKRKHGRQLSKGEMPASVAEMVRYTL